MPRDIHLLTTWAFTQSKLERAYELQKGVKLGAEK